jgi:hypothetical protein
LRLYQDEIRSVAEIGKVGQAAVKDSLSPRKRKGGTEGTAPTFTTDFG